MTSIPPSLISRGDAHPTLKNEKEREPSSFGKKRFVKPLPSELEDRSLNALKELLAKQKEETKATPAAPLPHFLLNGAAFSPDASGALAAIQPSGQVHDLLAKLVDTLIHVDQNGIKETTLTLDSPLFAGSVLTITEYNTAPKVFNVRFSASAEALQVFHAHAASLAALFEQGKRSFTIHRIDTSLQLEERAPLIQPAEGTLDKEDEKR